MSYIQSGNKLYLYKETAASSAVTGTLTETQCYQVLIPANTLESGDKLVLEALITSKIGTAGSVITRTKLSTSSTMPSSTTDRISDLTLSSTQRTGKASRSWNITSGNLYGLPFTSNSASPDSYASNDMGTKAFDVTVDNYLYISVILADITDSVTLYGFTLKNF